MRIPPTLLKVLLMLTCGIGPCVSALAQKPALRTLLIEFAGTVGRTEEKFILSAVNDQDANAQVSVDGAARLAKVRMRSELDAQAFEERIALCGLTVSRYVNMDEVINTDRSLAGALAGLPQFVDTGDRVADEADYQARKEAWLQAHPEAWPILNPGTPADE